MSPLPGRGAGEPLMAPRRDLGSSILPRSRSEERPDVKRALEAVASSDVTEAPSDPSSSSTAWPQTSKPLPEGLSSPSASAAACSSVCFLAAALAALAALPAAFSAAAFSASRAARRAASPATLLRQSSCQW